MSERWASNGAMPDGADDSTRNHANAGTHDAVLTEPADTKPVEVLLVDDQDLVRSGFSIILNAQPNITVVGAAGNGRDAVELAERLRPDVICMDVQMPVLDGLAATREITRRLDSRVIILTTFDRDDYLFDALDAGASGFLLKNAAPEELIRAVTVVAEGDALLAPEATRRVLERWGSGHATSASSDQTASAGGGGTGGSGSGSSGSGSAASELRGPTADDAAGPSGGDNDADHARTAAALIETLTGREREVLRLVALGNSNREIADELFLGPATVKTHVSSVLAKLGVRDRVRAVVFAHRNNLVS